MNQITAVRAPVSAVSTPRATSNPAATRYTQKQHTFEVLPRRWVVERTLAWITSYRRCARDYELLPAHHGAAVYWAMITLMTRRLARPR